MDTISYSETRANLKEVLDRVVADHDPVVVTRRRGESVVIVSLADWTAMEETTRLLSTPANARHILESITQIEEGGGKEQALVDP